MQHFGGIVFIAIALVIITQVSTRAVRASVNRRPSAEELKALEDEVEEVRDVVKDLRAQRLAADLARRNLSPEAARLIARIGELTAESETSEKELRDAEGALDEAEARVDESQAAVEAAQAALAEREAQEREAQERLDDLQAETSSLKARLDDVRRETARLKETLDNTRPAQTLALALEENSGGKEIVVFLAGGLLYRADRDELEFRDFAEDSFQIVPRRGRGHSCDAGSLGAVIGSVSTSSEYIYAWVYEDSFDAFVSLRSYLRSRGIRLGWQITSRDTVFTSGGSHTSSN